MSRREAREAARRMGERMCAYPCPHCFKFHVGTKGDRLARKRQLRLPV